MKAVYTTLLFLLTALSPVCSQLTTWDITPQIEFGHYSLYKGSIDGKYPITLYLEYSAKGCNDDWTRWTPKLVYGWYMYDKVGKKIPLVGHVCYADACESFEVLYVPNDPMNYRFTENCEMPDAREVFVRTREVPDSTYSWKMTGGQELPVTLSPVHARTYQTSATLNISLNKVDIAEFNLSQLAENEYIEEAKVLAKRYTNDRYHIVLEYGHQSNPGSDGMGMCGAGLEVFVAYLEINQDFEVVNFSKIQTESCIESLYGVEVEYDPEHPELGIKKK